MHSHTEKKSNTRILIAGALFLTSIFASLLIAYISSTGEKYWVLSRPIAEGVQLTSSDISLMKATFGSGASGYLSAAQNPIGSITRRTLKSGEILNVADLSSNSEDLNSERLSLAVRVADIPEETSIGDIVSLYQLFDARNGETVQTPQLVISGVFIAQISRKSANFGSDLALTISLRRDDVPRVLAATSSGRIVVVATSG
jgi:hypothetical protein